MKKNILIISMLIAVSSIYAGISENIDSLYNVAVNKDINYLIALEDIDDALDALDEDPLYYDSTLSVTSSVENTSGTYSYSSKLAIEVPIIEQVSIDANIDTDLDGSVGFTYSPLELPDSTVEEELDYENTSLYAEEYKEELNIAITESYLNYLLSIDKLDLQNTQAEIDKAYYEQKKQLHEYDEATLIEVQEALFDYNDSTLSISDKELDVYENRIALVELMGLENSEDIIIPETNLDEIFELVTNLEEVVLEENYSPMNSYDVVAALNTTIILEDSYDSMKLYDPTFNISGEYNTDGDFSASIYFKTSFDDYNADEKEDLLDDIELARESATQLIYSMNEKIEILQKEILSDKQQISSIKNQIEDNNYVMQEAASLLELGEYEELDYQELKLNEDNLKLSLIEAYITMYINQLTLLNYI